MSNHLHLVIKLNPEEAAQWSAKEVLERWCCLFKGSPIVQRYIKSKRSTNLTLGTGDNFAGDIPGQ
ncbi:hypothetical protein [Marinagarivorans algicola]|uniref:hypothetical protein n=1 Tax=Marinagarivorans algicola TaxID=1513270 RepID=UPI0037352E04